MTRKSPKPFLKLATPLACAAALALTACGGGGGGNDPFTMAVIGDVPYGTSPTDTAQSTALPAYLKALDTDADVSMALHVGDIHSGSQYCTQDYDKSIFTAFSALKHPLVYAPGDNEWTDCHKAKEGGGSYNSATGAIDYKLDANGNPIDYASGDPLKNLDLVRSIFFAQPGKTLGGSMSVHTQAAEFDPQYPTDKNYVENVWFENSGVLVFTLNMPGGSNNDTDPWYGAPAMSDAQKQEVANRTAADLRWIDTAFNRAVANQNYAVVIQLQADMWDLDGKTASHIAQYQQFIDKIAQRAKDYGKPVLLFNGDSHIYRSDNPLVQGAPCIAEPSSGAAAVACSDDAYANQPHGYNVPNFHRITVHGSTMPLEWLKLKVDPNYSTSAPATATSFGPFSWQRMQPKL
ncbi:hypothetical protein [Extensimonas sp. H3M7-6]|uniref:hypothetical protein n=1 Tax=Extensimonas soli TaxID=3031322 RepID=UPI0023D9DB49|nr:hypothetical protein [Extensimonas sp. H3M7-6]MDF1482598.1 hypothetical protein [Extensimonas sp. H3M7-6]